MELSPSGGAADSAATQEPFYIQYVIELEHQWQDITNEYLTLHFKLHKGAGIEQSV
jgi:hypothetical protein